MIKKAEFIALAAGKAKLSNKDTGTALDAILAQITESLKKGQDVQFIGFGTFKAVKRAERMGRNPSDGETIKIPATTAVTFKVGSTLKAKVAEAATR